MKRRNRAKRCSFGIPQGRSRYVLYAVVLCAHPEIVKIGQTMKWASRCRHYQSWNLADGDGILESAVYCITEEYVNLLSLEKSCLDAMGKAPYRGQEWFRSTLDHAKVAIESVLEAAQVSYTEF